MSLRQPPYRKVEEWHNHCLTNSFATSKQFLGKISALQHSLFLPCISVYLLATYLCNAITRVNWQQFIDFK
jgi:hypothetical protein